MEANAINFSYDYAEIDPGNTMQWFNTFNTKLCKWL
jgi:hypothetical protein